MMQYVTPDDKAAEIRMIRTAYIGTILIVEGDTDSRFFDRFLNSEFCKSVPVFEKNNVLKTVETLEKDGIDGIIGVVDADFWHIDGLPQNYDNILLTDFHDLEMMIVATKSLEITLEEYGSIKKIKKFLKKSKNSNVRNLIFKTCLPIGLLRWLSIKHKYGLKFEGLDFSKFIDKNSLGVDLYKLVRNVVSLTSKRGLRTAGIFSKLKKTIGAGPYDYLQVCCGHDFIAVLGVCLRKALGSKSGQLTSTENLGKFLRASYDTRDFKKTCLYLLSKDWELKNSPFKVFSV